MDVLSIAREIMVEGLTELKVLLHLLEYLVDSVDFLDLFLRHVLDIEPDGDHCIEADGRRLDGRHVFRQVLDLVGL